MSDRLFVGLCAGLGVGALIVLVFLRQGTLAYGLAVAVGVGVLVSIPVALLLVVLLRRERP